MPQRYMRSDTVVTHLHAGNPDPDRADDLQVVQDEVLQLSDAAALSGTNTDHHHHHRHHHHHTDSALANTLNNAAAFHLRCKHAASLSS